MIKKIFLIITLFIGVNTYSFENLGSKNNIYESSFLAESKAVLSDFEVRELEENKVYFKSNIPLEEVSDVTGFTISGKTINSIVIDNNGGEHYFTVSEPFTFWNNTTIRYSGGSGLNVSEFTLTYIVNNLPEPSSTVNRYVNANANGGGDGLTEETAWTIYEAAKNATPGTTVWMKAGNYGDIEFQDSPSARFQNSGTPSNPIKFIGYKEVIGDIELNYFDYGVSWNSNEMPTFSGNSAEKGNDFMWIYDSHYIIFRNMQFTNYAHGFRTWSTSSSYSSHLIFDNIAGKEFGSETFDGGTFIKIEATKADGKEYGVNHCRVLNSRFVNATMVAVALRGDGYNLVDNVKSYCDRTSYAARQDYHIIVNGNNNIIRNCHAENFNNTTTVQSSHGIGVRGNRRLDNDYNLIEKSSAYNVNECFFIRNYGSDYNVIKDCYAGSNGNPVDVRRGGYYIWGNANYNTIERCKGENLGIGLGWKDNTAPSEDNVLDDFDVGHDNIVKNCVFDNIKYLHIGFPTQGTDTGEAKDNTMINCTFNNIENMYTNAYTTSSKVLFINHRHINCIFNDVQQHDRGPGYINPSGDASFFYENSAFYGTSGQWSASVQPGEGNIVADPQFENESNGNFKLKSTSPLIDKGAINENVYVDFEGKVNRPQGASHDIGAYEFENQFTGSLTPDTSICLGDEITLVAEGGTNYEWGNGSTDSSITVNPTETTTYSVTITDVNGIIETLESEITVNIAPTVVASEDVEMCYGEEITLTASGVGDFFWSNGMTGSSITVSPTENTTYVVTASNSCSTEATDEVVVNVSPSIDLTISDNVSICLGESVTLTATSTEQLIWDNGSTESTITVSPTTTTTYSITSSNENCSEERSVTVTVNDVPSVVASDDVSICEGSSVILTAEGEGDFIWSNGMTGTSISVSPSVTTTYTVTASNECATEVTDEVVVIVSEAIDLNVDEDYISICSGESVVLTANSNAPLVWSTGETTSSITVVPNEMTIYTVSSNNDNCFEERMITVMVNNAPSVIASDDVSICSGEDVVLSAMGEGDFVWSNGMIGSSITVSPSETTLYTVTASNSCVTSSSDEVLVTVSEAVNLNVSSNVSICSGDSITLTANSNASILWSTGSTDSSITVNPIETTTYVVNSSNENCSDEKYITVTVNNTPSVVASNDVSICSGEQVILTASGEGNFTWSNGMTGSSITVNPTETTTYTVTSSNSCEIEAVDEVRVTVSETINLTVSSNVSICSGEEVLLTANSNAPLTWSTGSVDSNITVNPTETTTYTVTSSNENCSEEREVTVIIIEEPSVVASEDVSICSGEEITLTASGEGDFTWSNGMTGTSISVSPTITTTYSVTASNSCTVSVADEITVTVNDLPLLTVSNDVIIERGETISLVAEGDGSFLWSTGNTNSSIDVKPNVTTTYTVSLTSSNGCSVEDKVTVVVTEPTTGGITTVTAGNDATICKGQEIILIGAAGGDSYLWSTGEEGESIKVKPAKSTIYSVKIFKNNEYEIAYITVYIDNSCSMEVELKEFVLYPNPTEGDLYINLNGYQDKINIQIFNLNGGQVLRKDLEESNVTNSKKHFDLSRLPKGIYFFRLTSEGKSETKKFLII